MCKISPSMKPESLKQTPAYLNSPNQKLFIMGGIMSLTLTLVYCLHAISCIFLRMIELGHNAFACKPSLTHNGNRNGYTHLTTGCARLGSEVVYRPNWIRRKSGYCEPFCTESLRSRLHYITYSSCHAWHKTKPEQNCGKVFASVLYSLLCSSKRP